MESFDLQQWTRIGARNLPDGPLTRRDATLSPTGGENCLKRSSRIEPPNRTERRRPRRLCVSDLRGTAIPATGR